MYTRAILKQTPFHEVENIAQQLGIASASDMSFNALVDAILEKQSQSSSPISGSAGSSQQPVAGGGSTFFGGSGSQQGQDAGGGSTFFGGSGGSQQQDAGGGSTFFGSGGSQQGAGEGSTFFGGGAQPLQRQKDGSLVIGNSIIIQQGSASFSSSTNLETVALTLTPGNRLVLKQGRTCEITQIISAFGKSLEAAIYRVNLDGEDLVVKLYQSYNDALREPNVEVLSRIKDIAHDDVLRLHDFGLGKDKVLGRHCYELCDYAKGGNLLAVRNFSEKYTYQFIKTHVIPELFNGIRQLHRRDIIHCDLKPQNIFYRDEAQTDLVIGDYGSARIKSGKHIEVASTVIGTQFYLAPELRDRVVHEKNDYYSLGMILIHLLYPEQFARDDDFTKVDEAKYNALTLRFYDPKGDVLNFNPAYADLNRLIKGLTLRDWKNRWGEQQLEQWLSGRSEHLEILSHSALKEIRIDDKTVIYTADQLVNYIRTAPADWFNNLFKDDHGRNRMLDWLATSRNVTVKQEFQTGILQAYGKEGPRYLGEAIERYFLPHLPIRVQDQTFDLFTGDLQQTTLAFFACLDDQFKKMPLDDLCFHLFQFEFALRQLHRSASPENRQAIDNLLQGIFTEWGVAPAKDALPFATNIYQVIKKAIGNQVLEGRTWQMVVRLFWLFNQQRGFKDLDNQPSRTVHELGLFFAANGHVFFHPILVAEREVFLEKQGMSKLAKAGLQDFIFQALGEKAVSHIVLQDLTLSDDRHYEVAYTYEQTLTEYVKTQGIEKEWVRKPAQPDRYRQPDQLFLGTKPVFENFLEEGLKKHHLVRSSLDPGSLAKLERDFIAAARQQKLSVALREFYSGFLFALPWLTIFGLLVFSTPAGNSLIEQIFATSGLRQYVRHSEVFNSVIGFYPFFFIGLAFLALAILPKIWFGSRWDFVSLSWHLPVWCACMVVLPAVFQFSNWLYEFLGILLLGVVGIFGIGFSNSVNPHTKLTFTWLGFLMLGAGVVRLVLLIFINDDMGSPRGWVDLIAYWSLAAIALFYPALRNIWVLHDKRWLLLRSGSFVLLFLVFLAMGFGSRSAWVESLTGQVQPDEPKRYLIELVKFESMNLRQGPGTEYGAVAEVSKATPLVVEEASGTYWWKAYHPQTGQVGYIFTGGGSVRILREATAEDMPPGQGQ